MSLKEKEEKIAELEKKLAVIKNDREIDSSKIEETINDYKKETYSHLCAYDRVYLARKPERSHIHEFIDHVLDEFVEMRGDRYFKDDQAIVGGIGMFNNMPVTIIGHQKGRSIDENLKCQFGMASPEGYRKGMRLMKQAEKFNRPIITFVNTPGAFCGLEAEERGMGEAIARNLYEMSALKVPVLCILIGEGGSGGALAMAVGNEVWMLENAVYSILSPEGYASILWKDSNRAEEAAEVMQLTAQDLSRLGVIEKVIPEYGGADKESVPYIGKFIKMNAKEFLKKFDGMSGEEIAAARYKRFREM